jgi:hypothetical protein
LFIYGSEVKKTELSMDYVQKFGCFGCEPYQHKENGIKVEFSGYPDVLDPGVLTSIVTTRTDDALYGVYAGMDIQEALEILKEYGIKRIDYREQIN